MDEPHSPDLLSVGWDIWRAGRGGPRTIEEHQQSRLDDLISFARARSPLYRKLYSHLPTEIHDLRQLPVVTKPDLMAHFDDWVTDPAVTAAGIEGFAADKTLVGSRFLGRYAVCTTSGVTGTPGIFLHDAGAVKVYLAIMMMRGYLAWMPLRDLWAALRARVGVASVLATEGHFAGAVWMDLIAKFHPRLPGLYRGRTLSVTSPLPEQVQALNDSQPVILIGYPTALLLLAEEQEAGRLGISPAVVVTSAEWLAPEARNRIRAAFRCPVHDVYAASEFLGIAYECEYGWLHVNADWVLLEPVDQHGQPVAPGQESRTVLLTNLANRVQPIIRYDLGDSITLCPHSCPCGGPLPTIRVEGRRDDILYLAAPGGRRIPVPPQAVATALEEATGVRRFQVIQSGPAVLRVRLEARSGNDDGAVWEAVVRVLCEYLSRQGLPSIRIGRDPERPHRDPVTGKFRQVWAEPAAMAPDS